MYIKPSIQARRLPPQPEEHPLTQRGAKHGLDEIQPQNIDLARLLARRPPPPPVPRRASLVQTSNANTQIPFPPTLPSKRVTATQATPVPPPINLASKPTTIRHDIVEEAATSFTALSMSCIQCKDFSVVDAHAALFPRHTVTSIEELAECLTQPFDNDTDKARAFFTWLHHNIVYDVAGFFSGNLQHATPETTFSSGTAVCEGYAVLFERLADIIGLQCHKVSGHGKGYGITPLSENDPIPEMTSNHAWNCIMLEDEKWHLIDPCWGAGALDGSTWLVRLNPTWFIAPPDEFGKKHFPTDPSFQLTSEESTWEEYITAAPGPNLSADFNNLGLHPLTIEPATINVVEKRFTKFSVSKRCEHMSTAECDNYVFVLTTTENIKDFTPLSFNDQEGAWTSVLFTPRNGTITLSVVDTVNFKDAKGLGLAGFMKAKGKKPMSFKGLATWNVIHL